MPQLFNLIVLIIIGAVIIALIVWLFGYVTIIPQQVKQIIISIVALVIILYLIGILFGVVPIPNLFGAVSLPRLA